MPWPKKKPAVRKDVCGTCHFYFKKTEMAGICRRYPPVLLVGPGGTYQERPEMRRGQSCGEHKRRR